MSIAKDTIPNVLSGNELDSLHSSTLSSVSNPAWPPGCPFLGHQPLLTRCPPWPWCCGWWCPPGAGGAAADTVIVQDSPSPGSQAGCAWPGCSRGCNLERQAAARPGSIWLCLQWSILRAARARAASPTCCSSQLCQLSSSSLSSLDITTFGFFPSVPDPCHPSLKGCGSLLPLTLPQCLSFSTLCSNKGLKQCLHWRLELSFPMSDPVHC